MNAVVRPIRAYPIAFFTILACLVGWIFFIAAGVGASLSPSNLPLGPVIAAAIVAAVMGRVELKEWGRKLVTFRTALGWYALAIIGPVAIVGSAVLANYALGAPLPTRSQLTGWTELLAAFVFLLILVGIGEEAGWMGFAAPRLLNRYTFIMVGDPVRHPHLLASAAHAHW